MYILHFYMNIRNILILYKKFEKKLQINIMLIHGYIIESTKK